MSLKKIFILSVLLISPSFSFAQDISIRALKDKGVIETEQLPMEDVGSEKKNLGLVDHLKIQQVARGIEMPPKFGVNKITDTPVAKEVESNSSLQNQLNSNNSQITQESVTKGSFTQEKLSDDIVVGREIDMDSISNLPKNLPPITDIGVPPSILPPRGLPPLPSGAIYNEARPAVVNNPSRSNNSNSNSNSNSRSNTNNSGNRNQTRASSSTVAAVQYGQDPEKKAKFESCISDLKTETRGRNVRILRNDRQAYIVSWRGDNGLTEDSCLFNSN